MPAWRQQTLCAGVIVQRGGGRRGPCQPKGTAQHKVSMCEGIPRGMLSITTRSEQQTAKKEERTSCSALII